MEKNINFFHQNRLFYNYDKIRDLKYKNNQFYNIDGCGGLEY